MPNMLRRLLRTLKVRYLLATGRGLRSVQSVGVSEFLALFDGSQIGAAFEPSAESATETLLDHFAARTASEWPPVPANITDLRIDLARMSDMEIVARADAALAFELHPSGVKPAVLDDGRIDWSINPSDSREWLLMLHRHAWWALWAAAYRTTGDEKYAQAFVAQVSDWIVRHPMPPLKSEHHAPWRLMECGLRLRLSWIPAFGAFYRSPHFGDDAKLRMLRAIYDHCNFLRNFCTNRNHLVRESNGLVAAAVCFPEFAAAGDWLAEGIARLDRELRAQVNADGSHIEMSVGYQWLTIDEFEVTRSLLEPTSRCLPTADLRGTLEKMYAFLAAVMRPDRRFPQLNDGFILWDADRLAGAARELGRPDLEYAATVGEHGRAPSAASQYFANAGLHVMRSGWEATARYLVFDTGPYGGPHGHEDKLSFEVHAHGAPFIVDPGSYTYQPGDPYRDYFVSSQGHNTVLVDGRSQIRRWDPSHLNPAVEDRSFGEWRSETHFDWACGSYDEGYAHFALQRPQGASIERGVTHVRQVLFVKPDYWLIVDEVSADRPREFSACFHLAPDVEVLELHANAALLRSNLTGAHLLLRSVGQVDVRGESVVGSEAPVQGWYSPDHHVREPAATLIFSTPATSSTLIAWVLVPLGEADDPAGIEIDALPPDNTCGISFEVITPGGLSLTAGRDSFVLEPQRGVSVPARLNITRSDGRRWQQQ